VPKTFSPAFFLSRRAIRELSIFVDESGNDGLSDRHNLLTVVMHDQSENIADSIAAYEGAPRAKGLPDIPFHASPLMNGKDQYAGLDLRARKKLIWRNAVDCFTCAPFAADGCCCQLPRLLQSAHLPRAITRRLS